MSNHVNLWGVTDDANQEHWDLFRLRFCEKIKSKWRSHQGAFRSENRVRKEPAGLQHRSSATSKAKENVKACSQAEATAREDLLRKGRQHLPPAIPDFSPKGSRVAFAKQFRCGHWRFWRDNNLKIPQVCLGTTIYRFLTFLVQSWKRFLSWTFLTQLSNCCAGQKALKRGFQQEAPKKP